ncbi:hypothetical protein O181_130232 [Austropuccinia psidii MF-1]|uniref:Uncharacterized protein n=1 Tax=Austropuccinia psidii MF-1 TaxID=1389203 RepID=A0A9Q3L0S3_9BASI|nr:hypothetical protein [Austropuccinia psidii MF-1]
MQTPLAGGYELLLTYEELSGSGEDHKTLRRMELIVLQGQGQKDKGLVAEPNSFISRTNEGTGNELSFGKGRANSVNQTQNFPRTI